jgi:hypothetical protein
MVRRYKAIFLAFLVFASCSSQNGLMVKRDKDGSKMLVGISDKGTLMRDKAFAWFKEGYDVYKPDSASVRAINLQAPSLHIEVFGGTWCSDTHELLPGFYRVMDAAGITDAQISLHLVNRDKKTKDGSSDRYQITNVPTFIILKGDKQLGRVVESARTTIETDIATILTGKY